MASAAIHGLFLILLLNQESKKRLINPTSDAVIELVNIDIQQVIPQPTSLPAQKTMVQQASVAGQIERPVKTATIALKEIDEAVMLAVKASNKPKPETVSQQLAVTEAKTVQKAKATTRPTTTLSLPSHEADAVEIASIRSLVRNHLESFKYYPASARRRGIEGHVEVGFSLSKQGSADQISVLHGSGYAVLDHAAMETVHRAQPFPAEAGEYRFCLRFKQL